MPVDGNALLVASIVCATDAMYFEARGEKAPYAVQSVMEVIVNRAVDPDFPNSICGVVYQPGAFSFVHNGEAPLVGDIDLWRRLAYHAAGRLQHMNYAPLQATAFYSSDGDHDAIGCYPTHYLNIKETKAWRKRHGLETPLPHWVDAFTQVGTVGNHTFFTHHDGCE